MEQRLSDTKLAKKLADAAKLVSVGAEYVHYKQKNYRVLRLAILETDNEICVVYQALYGPRLTFIRPISSWVESVEVKGKTVLRFTKL